MDGVSDKEGKDKDVKRRIDVDCLERQGKVKRRNYKRADVPEDRYEAYWRNDQEVEAEILVCRVQIWKNHLEKNEPSEAEVADLAVIIADADCYKAGDAEGQKCRQKREEKRRYPMLEEELVQHDWKKVDKCRCSDATADNESSLASDSRKEDSSLSFDAFFLPGDASFDFLEAPDGCNGR